MQQPRPRWSSRTKLTIVLLLLVFGLYLLYSFRAAIQPFILAAVLAYVLSPLANWFLRRFKIGRGLATFLSYLVLFVVLIVILLPIVPPLMEQAASLNLDLLSFLGEIEALLGNQYTVAGQTIDVQAIVQEVEGAVRGLLEPVFGQTLTFVIEAISSLVWVVFIFIVSFYLAKDAPALQNWLENITPTMYREDFSRLRQEISQIWSAFFRGQLVLAAVVATIFTIAGLILGLPFALAMGVLAGLLEFLPSIGHGIWLTIASLLALFAGSTWLRIPNWAFMLLILGLHLFYQQFDLNYLIPRIVGRRVHLPPLVVILGIVTGALLAGVLGILLAAPTIASGRVLARYIYANLVDADPFPSSLTPSLPPPNPRWWRRTPAVETSDSPEDSGNP